MEKLLKHWMVKYQNDHKVKIVKLPQGYNKFMRVTWDQAKTILSQAETSNSSLSVTRKTRVSRKRCCGR